MKNTELKPCPFCHGMAKLTSKNELWDSQLYCATWIECEVCHAKSKEVWNTLYDNRPNDREKEVIEAWNRRV